MATGGTDGTDGAASRGIGGAATDGIGDAATGGFGGAATGAATWRIPARGPLEPPTLLAVLAAHAIPGINRQDQVAGVHQRTVSLPSGARPVRLHFGSCAVTVTTPPATAAERRELDALVRWWFDLDADLAPVNRVLARDPLLAPLVARRPGLRIVRYPAPFEAAATTVLGQQVSVAACRTFTGRLVARWGEPDTARHAGTACADVVVGANRTGTGGTGAGGNGGTGGSSVPEGRSTGSMAWVGSRLFPEAEVIAALDHEELRSGVGITRARARTLQAVAAALAEAMPVGGVATGAEPRFPLTRDELLALPGVGPWTADYLEVRAFANRDAFAPGDLVLRRALGGLSIRDAAERAEAWRPYRAHALFHLWTEEAYAR